MSPDSPRRAVEPIPAAGGEHIRPEWVEAAAQAMQADDIRRRGTSMHIKVYREQAPAVLAAVVPAIQAEALRDWAERVRENYPEDVFIPPSRDRLREVHEFCVSTGGTLDAISAALMRRAALIAEIDAKAIERGELP